MAFRIVANFDVRVCCSQLQRAQTLIQVSFYDYTGKLGCVVSMVVDSILPHAECGPNDHRKDALQFSSFVQNFSSSITNVVLKLLFQNLQRRTMILEQLKNHPSNPKTKLSKLEDDWSAMTKTRFSLKTSLIVLDTFPQKLVKNPFVG